MKKGDIVKIIVDTLLVNKIGVVIAVKDGVVSIEDEKGFVTKWFDKELEKVM